MTRQGVRRCGDPDRPVSRSVRPGQRRCLPCWFVSMGRQLGQPYLQELRDRSASVLRREPRTLSRRELPLGGSVGDQDLPEFRQRPALLRYVAGLPDRVVPMDGFVGQQDLQVLLGGLDVLGPLTRWKKRRGRKPAKASAK